MSKKVGRTLGVVVVVAAAVVELVVERMDSKECLVAFGQDNPVALVGNHDFVAYSSLDHLGFACHASLDEARKGSLGLVGVAFVDHILVVDHKAVVDDACQDVVAVAYLDAYHIAAAVVEESVLAVVAGMDFEVGIPSLEEPCPCPCG